MSQSLSYTKNSHFFIKFFLLDDSISLNDWGVTRDALLRNLSTFVGKPFIIMPNFGHPNPPTGDMMFDVQEPYRVGTILETGIDTNTNKAWGVAEITNENAIKTIKSGDIKFVSPSILFHPYELSKDNSGKEIITNFTAAHVAGVKEPAFGMSKAMIKGQCSGDTHTCKTQLNMVQASIQKTVSPCGCITTFRAADKSDCLQRCFHEKKKAGLDVTDPQNIAICMSECRKEKKTANVVDDLWWFTARLNAFLSAKELTSKRRTNLNDSDFAYVCSDGVRKLPIYDANHTRNALARFNQTQGIPSAERPKVLAKICRAAKKFRIDSDLCSSRSQSADYATIKRGTVKLQIGSLQDKLLHARNLPHSHVHIDSSGKKTIKRYP